jgi:acid phosphatase family membrane protein YuiD
MNFFTDLLHNPLFVAPAIGWFTAQLIKTILYIIIHREFNAERIFGAGGMPSSRSATVCSLVTATAFRYGASSFPLPMAFFFAFIVMYDAMGVRRETGEQAKVLNEMIGQWREMGNKLQSMDPMDQFKEFVGHTPLQVVIGALLGILIGSIVSNVML